MRKFDLPSVEEPRREDYARPEPPPKKQPAAAEKRKEAADRSRSGSRRARRRRTSRSPSAGASRRREHRAASNERPRRRKRSTSSSKSPPPAAPSTTRGGRHRSGSRGRTRNPSPPGQRSATEIPSMGRTGPSRLASGKSDLYSGGLLYRKANKNGGGGTACKGFYFISRKT